jgi:hypothetical protein
MNFLAQVEEHLRDLGAEARKKHPGMYVQTDLPFVAKRLLLLAHSGQRFRQLLLLLPLTNSLFTWCSCFVSVRAQESKRHPNEPF